MARLEAAPFQNTNEYRFSAACKAGFLLGGLMQACSTRSSLKARSS
jgi:hypothetical protein